MQENYYIIIPAQVRLDDRLSLLARLLYGDIAALAQSTGECWASNTYFSNTYKRDRTRIIAALKELQEFGYVQVQYRKPGRNGRVLIPCCEIATASGKNTTGTCRQNATPLSQKHNMTCRENTTHNIHINKQVEYSPLFNSFWSAYPRKTAKQNALKAFNKLNVTEALLTEMLAALDWQRQCEEWTKENGRFIPHPATWLNGHRWEDGQPNKPAEPARPALRCETYMDENGRRCARFVP